MQTLQILLQFCDQGIREVVIPQAYLSGTLKSSHGLCLCYWLSKTSKSLKIRFCLLQSWSSALLAEVPAFHTLPSLLYFWDGGQTNKRRPTPSLLAHRAALILTSIGDDLFAFGWLCSCFFQILRCLIIFLWIYEWTRISLITSTKGNLVLHC